MNEFRPKPVTYKELTDMKNSKEFRRVSTELDNLEHEIESLKRRKLETRELGANEAHQRVCLVIEGSSVISKLAELATENKGWKIVSVNDIDSALSLLRMRNWDAVLVDDDLSSNCFIATFREWEKSHRVNRQKNVMLMSGTYLLPDDGSSSSFQVPNAFDGAMGKPIHISTMKSFLDKAIETSTCFASDIVTR